MESKKCCTCHVDKPLTEYNRRARSGDGKQSRCRTCSAAWYQQNRDVHRANVRRNNDELRRLNRERLGEYLSRQHCVDCGLDDIRVLEFDHRPGEVKTGIIGKMLVDSVSWRRILQEIAKCDVRCANCHRIVTAERAGNWRQRHREAG